MDINLARRNRRQSRAGRSAEAKFRERRFVEMRSHWRDWPTLIGGIVASLVLTIVTNGVTQLVFAGVTGALTMVVAVGWLIGGHVRSLPWAWGAVGERSTAEVLDALDETWACIHDVPRERGNWDHVLVGPPGVLVLDTKVLTAPARASDDALRAGRQVMPGSTFRGAAVGLAEALGEDGGGRPWVQPVVVVWGDFDQGIREEHGVVYVDGSALAEWLTSLPSRISEERRRELARRVEALPTSEPPDDRLPPPKSWFDRRRARAGAR